MKFFVFRNNTVEPFFTGSDYAFSGYDDISHLPEDADTYIWFYQIPVKYDTEVLTDEVRSFIRKMAFVVSQTDPQKTILLFTLQDSGSVQFTGDDARLEQAVAEYNAAILGLTQKYGNAKRVDFTNFTRNYAAADLIDWKFYFLSQMPLNPRLAKPFKAWFDRQQGQIALKRKKCLVLDLDNTLWGGVLGEEGIDGIRIGGDYPGKAFHCFQEALLELGKNGVLLCVCSKNNEKDVWEAWEKNPFMVLRKEHFAACRINWNDKANNLREIAAELNLGLDSFVFVDDNPTERELIRQILPMVSVPDFPTQPYELPSFFDKLVDDYFKVYSVTNEDRNKTEQYRANALRAEARQHFVDFAQFLQSLEMRLTIEQANDFHIARISQMTQKTNQFNLTTRRYTDADIKRKLAAGARIWCLSVADKFGDNGMTGCLVVENGAIDTFLLSCRILGKGIEKAFLYTVLNHLQRLNEKSIRATYLPTAKNIQVEEFYEKCGFRLLTVDTDGTKHYEIALGKIFETESYYDIIEK